MIQFPASQFNPFTVPNTRIYSVYCRWSGNSDYYGGDSSELKLGEVYRVLTVNIGNSCSYVKLQEMSTGKILSESFNSVIFESLPCYVAYGSSIPQIGKRCRINVIDRQNGSIICQSRDTSEVRYRECISGNVWAVITDYSAYVVSIL